MKDTEAGAVGAIGTFVRERRESEGLSQRRLAELAGVGTRFVVELERGKPTVRMDVVDRVLGVFGFGLRAVELPRPATPPARPGGETGGAGA